MTSLSSLWAHFQALHLAVRILIVLAGPAALAVSALILATEPAPRPMERLPYPGTISSIINRKNDEPGT